MRKVKASAKTREEAIQKALSELGVEMYEVDDIQVVDEGSKGLFGFGARPVQVEVTVEHLSEEPRRERGDRGRGERGGERRGGRDRDRERDRDQSEDKPAENKTARAERPARGGRNARSEGDQKPDRENRRSRSSRGGRGRGGRDRDAEPRKDREEAPKPEARKEEPKPARKEPVETRVDDAVEPAPPEGIGEDINITITDEQGQEAAALLEEVIAKMGLSGVVEFVRMDDGSARLNVTSDDGALLIGRKGRNLSAMQYLINRIISRNDTAENTERLMVDVEGYVDRRRASLEDMARNFADRARSTGRNMRLKPLSPQERRIIHLALEKDPDLRTYSLGDSLYRSVVISPREGAKSGGNGNGNGGSDREGDRESRSSSRGSRGGRGRRGRGGRGRGGGGSNPQRHEDSDFDAGAFGD